MLICPNCERDETELLPLYGYCPPCTRRREAKENTISEKLRKSPEVRTVENRDGTFTHTFLFHFHAGNCVCHTCRYHCSVCGDGEWCETCHEHKTVRGSCEKCDPCGKCERNGPLRKEATIEISSS